MKSYCAMAALIATLAVSPLALGNDHADAAKAKPKTEAAAAPHVQFEAMQFGKVIEVGPDGKVEVKDFGGQLPKEVLDKLPQEVRDLLQKSSGKKSAQGHAPALPNVTATGKLKIVVEKDGKRQEFESDLTPPASTDKTLGAIGGLLQQLQGNDALPEEAQKALDDVSKALKAQKQASSHAIGGHGRIGEKLDKILERLDHLESEVQELKAKKDK